LEDEIINEAIAEALPAHYNFEVFSSSLLLSSQELSDKKVYEPQIQALLGTASHFCEVVVLRSRTHYNFEFLKLTCPGDYDKVDTVRGLVSS
jgi:hypothetical protein